MGVFLRRFIQNGIKQEYSSELKLNIRIANVLNVIFILLVIPYILIYFDYGKVVWLTSILILIHLISLVFIHFHLHKTGRFILSVNTGFSVLLIASMTFISDATDGMAPKIRMLGGVAVPFVVFSLKEKKYIIAAIMLNLLFIFSFNYLNNILNLDEVNKNLDTPGLRNLSIIIASLMLIITFFYYKTIIAKKTDSLARINFDLKNKNEELITIGEELRQNNEELLSLKEEVQRQLNTIKERENQLNTITNAISDAIILINNEGNIVFWNKGAEQIFGYLKEEVLNKDLHNIIAATQYREKAYKNFAQFKISGKGNALNKTIEVEAVRSTGTKFPVELYITPIQIKGQWNAVGIVRDITSRKQTELALKKSEEKFKTVFNSSYAGISILTQDGIHIDTNPNCEKIHGYTRKELLGRRFRDFSHPDDIKQAVKATKMLLTGTKDKVELELRLFHKITKEIVWIYAVLTKYTPIKNKKNTDILVVFQDITKQKSTEKELRRKNKLIKLAHKNIKDSIEYARTIQQSLLVNKTIIDTFLDNYFILFKPKEKVSGDFYYINRINKYLIIAIADCTGHGVPGAFLTMLGITYLHDIVRNEIIDNPGDALNALRERFKVTFKEFGHNNPNGMDIALCAINMETHTMQYAGAFNPLIIIRNDELIEYKATRNPIGYFPVEKPFVTHNIQLQNNDTIYLYTDGFQDQLGGEEDHKFMTKIFKNLLLSMHKLPINAQKYKLEETLKEWQGNNEQTDDILIFGMKWNT